jgi:hypothetical protein
MASPPALSLEALTAALAAAQADAARERAARVAAEEQAEAAAARAEAAAARAEAAAARAENEREVRLAAEKEIEATAKEAFFIQMMAISSSSAADTASNADEERRRAPQPEVVTNCDFFAGFPAAAGDAAGARAAADLARLAAAWAPPPVAESLDENRDVHPAVEWALRAALPARGLRVWHDRVAADCVALAHVRPDFVLTGDRDAAASMVGALLVVEVKLPGDLSAAARQTRAYLRRRVFKLCCEADARGEALDGVSALGVATDGAHAVFVRVASGGPPAGASFRSLMPHPRPCPVLQTSPLELFGAWDFRSSPPPWRGASAPPPALLALARLCAAPALLSGGGGALTSLRVTLRDAAPGAGAPGGAREVVLALGERLGSGGTSDVYALDADGADCVLKVARVATAGVGAGFDAEAAALGALRGTAAADNALVPTLVGSGARAPAAERALAGAASGAAPWPVLMLRPRGVPLEQWVAARVAGAEAAAARGGARAAAQAARRQCADAVAPRVLAALLAAHEAGWAHCDVRPANVAYVEGRGAMLVDWGNARRVGDGLVRSGVEAFTHARVWRARGVDARPHHDAVAALYTWLAVAFGDGCAAPWLGRGAVGESSDDGKRADSERRAWVAALAARDEGVARVARALEVLEGMTGRADPTAAVAAAREGLGL